MSNGYLNMTQRWNARTCNRLQSHHKSSKYFVCRSPRSKPCRSNIFVKQIVIHKELVPEGQAVNSHFYSEVIGKLLKRRSRVRAQFRAVSCWFLLHYNGPPHSALVMKTYLAKHCALEISHPPCSPDLASGDIFLFHTLKTVLKKRCWRHEAKHDGRTECCCFIYICWQFSIMF
jgi:hypothetical protein